MYTPIINRDDLDTQMYPEIRSLITRNNDFIAEDAIQVAIAECKMYLNKYDLDALFGNPTADTPPSIYDPMLNGMVKTIAVWQLLRLANPSVDLALANTWYEQTIDKLKAIQSGKANPAGWPYKDTTGYTAPQGDSVYASYEPKTVTRW